MEKREEGSQVRCFVVTRYEYSLNRFLLVPGSLVTVVTVVTVDILVVVFE